MLAYQAALGTRVPMADETKAGTFARLITDYCRSAAFANLKPSSQKLYRLVLDMRKLATSAERETLAAKRTLAEIERKVAAIVRAIEDGAYTPTLKARLTALEQEKAQAEALIRAGKHAPVLRLHTNLPELYRNKIGRLGEALNTPETVTEAAEIMRGLIDRIVLTPVAGKLRAELHGDLAVLARFAQEGERRSAGDPARLSVVAGERNHLNLLFNAPRLELPLWWRGSATLFTEPS